MPNAIRRTEAGECLLSGYADFRQTQEFVESLQVTPFAKVRGTTITYPAMIMLDARALPIPPLAGLGGAGHARHRQRRSHFRWPVRRQWSPVLRAQPGLPY